MPRPTSFALGLYFVATYSALGLYLPYVPAWLEARGFVGSSMSALVLLLPATAIVVPPISGMLADSWGLRGGLLRLTCLGGGLAFALLALGASRLEVLPFAFVFGCFLVFAAFRSTMSGLTDVIALEHAQHYGRLRLWGSIGFLTAAWLGGHLVDPTRPVLLPVCIAICLGLSYSVARLLPRAAASPPLPVPSEVRRLLGQSGFRWLLLASFLGCAAGSAYDMCLTLHLRKLGASGGFVGTAWAVGTLAEVVLMAWLAPHVARLGAPRLLLLAYAGAAVRWALLASVESLPLLMALQPLHAISFALMWLSALSVLKEETGDGALATAQGLFAASCAMGNVSGMAIWGGVYASDGGRTVFAAASLLAALATVPALLLGRTQRATTLAATGR